MQNTTLTSIGTMEHAQRTFLQAIRNVAPPPLQTVSQWADTNRYLSRESSAEPGRWNTDRAPYQRGMMDAMHERGVRMVVIMTSAQVGKTEVLSNVIAYHIEQDPAPILALQPTLDMAETFSKDRLAPMFRDTPTLRDKVADPKSRMSGNTLLHKVFDGGHITLAGANSPASLASRPVRVLLCDEVDRYPLSAGTEGDPVSLAIKRTNNFPNRRIILTSTPTVKGVSRIESAFLLSDQRRYYVPCPQCGEYQTFQWSQIQFDPVCPKETTRYQCLHCSEIITEAHKPRMLALGEWRATAEFSGVIGFHLNELYSPWRRWSEVVVDFLAAKRSPETLKTWINTSLGETWEDEAEKSDPISLLARRENYTSARLPADIVYLTAGVDVQDNRLELEIVGWRQTSRDDPPESWGVEYHVLSGDPARTGVWQDLDAVLMQNWTTDEGRKLRVQAACIDSGGHHTARVYAWCDARKGRRIYAVKGLGGARPIWKPKAGKSQKYKAEVWHIGVDTAKDAWYARLKIAAPGPGYCHFPLSYSESYFDGLTAEQVRTRYSKGHPVREWYCPPGKRNEPLDIRCYALAALLSRPVDWPAILNRGGPATSATMPKSPLRTDNSRRTDEWGL